MIGLQIHHFNIMHFVSLPLPPQKKKFRITIFFDFLWDDCNTHKKLETMEMQNLGRGAKMVN